jgi:hypothetical protein
VVHGTWAFDGDRVRVAWFGESGRPPSRAIGAEVDRLAGIVGRDLRVEIEIA